MHKNVIFLHKYFYKWFITFIDSYEYSNNIKILSHLSKLQRLSVNKSENECSKIEENCTLYVAFKSRITTYILANWKQR